MARKSIVEREKKRKFLSFKFLELRKALKEKIRVAKSLEEKLLYQSHLQALPRNSSFTRLF